VTRGLTALALLTLALAACAPRPPEGFDADTIDSAIERAMGGPGVCVLLARRGEKRAFHRYGSNVTCGRILPSCLGEETVKVANLLDKTAAGGPPVQRSCPTAPDRSRSVGWAAGPAPGQPDIVYAAYMEGDRALPGMVMADRLTAALERAGL
jgi:hypothetical protein